MPVEVQFRLQHLELCFHRDHQQFDFGFLRDVVDFEVLVVVAGPFDVAFEVELDRCCERAGRFDVDAEVERQSFRRLQVENLAFEPFEQQEPFGDRVEFGRADLCVGRARVRLELCLRALR